MTCTTCTTCTIQLPTWVYHGIVVSFMNSRRRVLGGTSGTSGTFLGYSTKMEA